ncbi:hypothetical protein JKA74_18365 [Marivirga sp. S37H4]|uniref:Glycosyl transferase family 1 domain-containing protein n=1 Tax=Marivirga aurantiaca TaxID=2802615 RepID=A0A934X268_9BACT|nr:hypothetical protein [Marivirga aurantiaca]MBK6267015.1 hypothetical protein [Marivirga aurantiaca]
MKQKKLGIFLYNRLFDALIQSNFWLYIQDYLDQNQSEEFKIYLITYEDKRFPLTKEQKQKVKNWEKQGLIWTPLNWNPGIGKLAKIKDIVTGFFATYRIKLKGCNHFISLGSVSGSYLYLYHTLLRFKFFLYQFEPHSEYAIDNKMWPKNSPQYKISHYLERKAANNAKVIASGTKFMHERLKHEWKVKASFFKIPTVTNDSKFKFSEENRKKMRNKLGLSEEIKVLFYPGKFGDLYYRAETAWMFKWVLEEDDNFHFLIVTPHQDEEVIALFDEAGVPKDKYTIAHSDYSEIHHYFAAADFAVIAVPPGPSKKFISNIKVGEYLTAGLPFLITEGISEDYIYAKEKNVGVVVKDFEEEYIKRAVPEINNYLSSDRKMLRKHCREIGLDYRGFKGLNQVFKAAINALHS